MAHARHIMKQHDRAREMLNDERSQMASHRHQRSKAIVPSPANVWAERQLALAYGAIGEQDIAEALLQELPLGLYELETLIDLGARHGRAGRLALARRSLARAESTIPAAWHERRVAGWDYAALKRKCGVLSLYESRLGPWLQLSLGYGRLGMTEDVERIGREHNIAKRFTQVVSWIARSQPAGTPPSSLQRLLLTDADYEPEWRIHRELTALVAETLIGSGVDEPWHHRVYDPEEPPALDAVLNSVHKVDVVFGIMENHIVSGVPLEPAQLARLSHRIERSDVEEWANW